MTDKPKYIEAEYTEVIRFDIKKLGINWNNVEEYWVKQKTLYITYSNGLIEQYEAAVGKNKRCNYIRPVL